MDDLLSAAVIWILLGFVLFLLEFVIPGLILFFFAVGAWVVGILCLFIDLSLNAQLIIFLISAILSILLLRRWAARVIWKRKDSKELMEDEFLGKKAVAQTNISPDQNGRVDFKGTSWEAASDDVIEKGETVVITGNESIVLIVKSTRNI